MDYRRGRRWTTEGKEDALQKRKKMGLQKTRKGRRETRKEARRSLVWERGRGKTIKWKKETGRKGKTTWRKGEG